jgi:hypothetical protein
MKYTMIVHMKNTGATVKLSDREMDDYQFKNMDILKAEWFWVIPESGAKVIIHTEDISYIQFMPEQPLGELDDSANSR